MQSIKHAKQVVDELCLPILMRTFQNPTLEYPPKVKKNTTLFPIEMTFSNESYTTRVAIPSRSSKHGSGGANQKEPIKITDFKKFKMGANRMTILAQY